MRADAKQLVRGRWWRWYSAMFSAGFLGIAQYRIQRAGYLTFGRRWRIVHAALAPIWMLVRPFVGPLEIHYLADIGPGFRVLHPALGAVVSGRAVLGADVILAGGNCIGGRGGTEPGSIVIGDEVVLGVNAVVMGPAHVGTRAQVSAGAVVVGDVAPEVVVGGVPARPIGLRADVFSNPPA